MRLALCFVNCLAAGPLAASPLPAPGSSHADAPIVACTTDGSMNDHRLVVDGALNLPTRPRRAPIPEPSTLFLVGSGLVGVALTARWRRRDGVDR